MYREWRARAAPGAPQSARQGSIRLDALWSHAAREHELLYLTGGADAARHLSLQAQDGVVKSACARRTVVIRHAGAAGDKPAVDASGVVNTLELPMAELPALTSPHWVFLPQKWRESCARPLTKCACLSTVS